MYSHSFLEALYGQIPGLLQVAISSESYSMNDSSLYLNGLSGLKFAINGPITFQVSGKSTGICFHLTYLFTVKETKSDVVQEVVIAPSDEKINLPPCAPHSKITFNLPISFQDGGRVNEEHRVILYGVTAYLYCRSAHLSSSRPISPFAISTQR